MVTLTRSTLTTDTALCQPAISRQVHPHIHHQATFKASLGVSQGGRETTGELGLADAVVHCSCRILTTAPLSQPAMASVPRPETLILRTSGRYPLTRSAGRTASAITTAITCNLLYLS